MTKEFAMLTAAQRLTKYFSREFNRLDDTNEYPNNAAIQAERLIRIREVNELSDTLNELFGTLSGSPESKLFSSYEEQKNEMDDTDRFQSDVIDVLEEAHLEYEEQNRVLMPLGTTATLSPAQQRADQMLREYSETATRDVALHLPENDRPFEILSEMKLETSRFVDSGEKNYLRPTVEDIPLDSNVAQIEDVQNAVEKGIEEVRQGTDIHINEYLTRKSRLVTGLIEADIRNLLPENSEHGRAVVVE
ncbi:hypothetical protein [Paenibacillus sp. FSL R7-0026]|uniref:hypothetical protein n=1 Tax=Paenibacillus sp. FSL R7-0026 TaxID=2921668 RepID=UPI0030F8CA16